MTCYMHHLHDVFEALGLEYDKANRERVDSAIRKVLDVPADAHCPEVWAAVKATPRADLTGALSRVLER